MKRFIVFIASFLVVFASCAQNGKPDTLPKQPKKGSVQEEDSLFYLECAVGDGLSPEYKALTSLNTDLLCLSKEELEEIRNGRFRTKKFFAVSYKQHLRLIYSREYPEDLILVARDYETKRWYPVSFAQDAIQTPIGVVFTATLPSRLFCVLKDRDDVTYLRDLGDGRSLAYKSVFTKDGIKSYMAADKFADGSSKEGYSDRFSGDSEDYSDYTVEIDINLWRQD